MNGGISAASSRTILPRAPGSSRWTCSRRGTRHLPATLASIRFSGRRPASSSPTTRLTATRRRLTDTFRTPRSPADWWPTRSAGAAPRSRTRAAKRRCARRRRLLDGPRRPTTALLLAEYVGHWLNLWAKSKRLPVRFEVLNAGRKASRRAISPPWFAPKSCHCGRTSSCTTRVATSSARVHRRRVPEGRRFVAPTDASPRWLQRLARSAVMARVQAALRASADGQVPEAGLQGRGAGLDEFDPELSYPYLPIKLTIIQRDSIDSRRPHRYGQRAGHEFVHVDGQRRPGARSVSTNIPGTAQHRQLSFPLPRAERLATFRTAFLPCARFMGSPSSTSPARFVRPRPLRRCFHPNYAGVRIRGWVAFNQLLPTVEKHLADGSWPRPCPLASVSVAHLHVSPNHLRLPWLVAQVSCEELVALRGGDQVSRTKMVALSSP